MSCAARALGVMKGWKMARAATRAADAVVVKSLLICGFMSFLLFCVRRADGESANGQAFGLRAACRCADDAHCLKGEEQRQRRADFQNFDFGIR